MVRCYRPSSSDLSPPLQSRSRVLICWSSDLRLQLPYDHYPYQHVVIRYGNSDNDVIGVVVTKDLIFVDPEDAMPLREFLKVFGRPVERFMMDDTCGEALSRFKRGRNTHLGRVVLSRFKRGRNIVLG